MTLRRRDRFYKKDKTCNNFTAHLPIAPWTMSRYSIICISKMVYRIIELNYPFDLEGVRFRVDKGRAV